MALSDGLGPGDQRDRTVRLEANIDIFARRAASGLDVIGKAQAAQQPPCFAAFAPCGKAGDVRSGEGEIEGVREGAAVDLVAEGVSDGHCRSRDHVEAAERGTVETALPGRRIDQALDDVDRLSKAGAAGDADRGGIGKYSCDLQCYRRDAIDRAR